MAQQTPYEWYNQQMVNKQERERMTAVEWFYQRILAEDIKEIFEQAKAMEKEQIVNAMMHSLDEDGHTGDWKIKFVNDYYNKTFKS
jgi:tetrahydromethanopterin S-methyltransferase subunit B